MSGKVARKLRKMAGNREALKSFIPTHNHIKQRHIGQAGKRKSGRPICHIEAPARVYYKFLKRQYKRGLSLEI